MLDGIEGSLIESAEAVIASSERKKTYKLDMNREPTRTSLCGL